MVLLRDSEGAGDMEEVGDRVYEVGRGVSWSSSSSGDTHERIFPRLKSGMIPVHDLVVRELRVR